jgi:hypothetical protein
MRRSLFKKGKYVTYLSSRQRYDCDFPTKTLQPFYEASLQPVSH